MLANKLKILWKISKRLKRGMKKTIFVLCNAIFNILSIKMGFLFVVCVSLISIRSANFLSRSLALKIQRKNKQEKIRVLSYRFISAIFPMQVAERLFYFGYAKEAKGILPLNNKAFYSTNYRFLMAKMSFEIGEFENVEKILLLAPGMLSKNWGIIHFSALASLLNGNEDMALHALRESADNLSSGWCPHQNIAACYPSVYQPNKFDIRSGKNGLLFDAYNYLAQRVMHVGEGQLSLHFYEKAFDAQKKLAATPLILSLDLRKWLKNNNIQEFRILSWEWLSQIGHLGLLDILFRMRTLGWWTGTAIILLPPDKLSVANEVVLSLFHNEKALFLPKRLSPIYEELFSLQRYGGLSFNAWQYSDGEIIPWLQAGARIMKCWDNIYPDLFPLRNSFDKVYEFQFLTNWISQFKKSHKMGPQDWYVCLHVRDSEFHGEVAGVGQTHRNSDIKNYLETIRWVTQKGGWVIKMGAKNSIRLPKMPGVIDYARSSVRSELMDIYLLRHARLFIGTTSGFTNIAISFGLHCALVNCITVDSQLWNNKVRFVLKKIRVNNRLLNQRELTTTPWRWRQFSAEVLRRHDATVIDNTADEILETVKETMALYEQDLESYLKNFSNSEKLINNWRSNLEIPEYYGNARPSMYYLKKHENDFLEIDYIQGKIEQPNLGAEEYVI